MTQVGNKLRKPPVRKALGMDLPVVEILDVGAMSEGEDRYAGLLAQELASVVGFEPNPVELARLQAMRVPGKRYLPYFLGKGGPATFHVTKYPGCCSLFEPDPAVINMFMAVGTVEADDNFYVVKKVAVETRKLDEVPGLPGCDFMKLDIQGGELDVLQGGTRVLGNVGVVEVEAEFIAIYKNQPLFGDLQVFLRGQGFVLHKMIDVGGRTLRPMQYGENPYEPMSQLMWADAVFVRDFSTFEGWADEQLLKAAMVLYEIYCSHDLVHRLLTEYDRRRGMQTAAAFMKTLVGMGHIPVKFMNQKLHS